MTDQPEPTWQPIQQLPLLAHIVDGMLADNEEQLQTFQAVRHRPHVLDDAIVDRAIRLYQEQLEDMWLYEEQFRRWLALPLSAAQRTEVERLAGQLPRLRELDEAILTLLAELSEGTIDKMMAKSDLELGIEFLSRPSRKRGGPKQP